MYEVFDASRQPISQSYIADVAMIGEVVGSVSPGHGNFDRGIRKVTVLGRGLAVIGNSPSQGAAVSNEIVRLPPGNAWEGGSGSGRRREKGRGMGRGILST